MHLVCTKPSALSIRKGAQNGYVFCSGGRGACGDFFGMMDVIQVIPNGADSE